MEKNRNIYQRLKQSALDRCPPCRWHSEMKHYVEVSYLPPIASKMRNYNEGLENETITVFKFLFVFKKEKGQGLYGFEWVNESDNFTLRDDDGYSLSLINQ